MQPVFVTRSSADSRAETINEIKRRANSNFTDGKASSETKQPSWQQVAIFPEGTPNTNSQNCFSKERQLLSNKVSFGIITRTNSL